MINSLRARGLHRLFSLASIRVRPTERPFSSTYQTRQKDLEFRNQCLIQSVEHEDFDDAERLRLHLASKREPIIPHPIYEVAALEQIRLDGRQNLQGFLNWLRLVPDNQNPERVDKGPLTRTRDLLFRTGNPARNLRLLTEFSLVCAAKGYGQLVFDDLVSLMSRFEHADRAVAFFLAFEAALVRYDAKHRPGMVEETISRQRYLLIMLCCDAGWLKEAVQVVQKSSTYRIKNACDRLLALLRAQNDTENVALVEACLSGQRHTDTEQKLSTVQRLSNLFQARDVPGPKTFYSTRSIIHGSKTLRPRAWIASHLKEVKRLIAQRSLVYYRQPGSILPSIMAHYDACKGYPHGLPTLQKRALAASDPCSYTWLCKEMFYLRESRKFADIVAVFGANFDTEFLPPKPWKTISELAQPADQWRTVHAVPTKLQISAADAWIIWNALVRLAPSLPEPLAVLEALHHSVVHYASQLTDRQFRAFPTSYTAVFRSIIWAYGELRAVDKAVAAASDISLIGKIHATNVGILDELAGVHARVGDVPAATRLLHSLEKLGPRLATYGVLMDAYLQAGHVNEAAKLEVRMKQKCEYTPGDNWRFDATLKALRAAEAALDSDSVGSLYF
ncbi:hypothetical protein C8R43DRAFT_1130255 [Mycena crocata]|nr:hypothetical protein C8R43DRAFT_1130255 [Mycena crocata]